MELKTPRLILRPFESADVKDIVRNINDLEVSKWLLVVPYPYRMKDAKEFVKKNKKKWRTRPQTDFTFGIELKEEGRIIGGIGLHRIDKFHGKTEIGYWLGQDYWRNGYGSEALQAVISFAFGRLKLRKLEAGVFDGNPSSGKLLEKFGFKHEGTRIQTYRCKADGKVKDEYLYGLLKKDYRPNRK